MVNSIIFDANLQCYSSVLHNSLLINESGENNINIDDEIDNKSNKLFVYNCMDT